MLDWMGNAVMMVCTVNGRKKTMMRTIQKFALAAAFTFGASAAFAADPVEGVWQTKADDNGNYGHIEVKPCGPAFCGILVKSFDSTGAEIASDNIGKQIIWDMVAYADGLYDDGQIWSPDRDKTYNSDMTLTGDSLAVRGCVFGICRDGGTWTRVQ
jgi:uncharacterized protein (DUF2147 family)